MDGALAIWGLLFVVFRGLFPTELAKWNAVHRDMTVRTFWAYWAVLAASQAVAGLVLSAVFPVQRSTVMLLAMLPVLALISRFAPRARAEVSPGATAGDRTRTR